MGGQSLFWGNHYATLGSGGQGKQVRDLLHPDDLYDLIGRQILQQDTWQADIYNVGGGQEVSTSLCELTALCREIVGREIPITSDLTTSSVDIPWYISDHQRCSKRFQWNPKRNVRDIITEISVWLRENEDDLAPPFLPSRERSVSTLKTIVLLLR